MNKYTLLSLILCLALPACCLRKDGCKKKDAPKTSKDMSKEGQKKSATAGKNTQKKSASIKEEAQQKAAPMKQEAAKHAPKKVMAPVTK